MTDGDKKGLALLILGKHKGDDEAAPESDEGGDEGVDSMGLKESMGELIDAIKNGDKAAAAEAFKQAMTCCTPSSGGEYE